MTTTAVILAAGLGSRLRPYTDHQPKGFLQIYEDVDSLIEMSVKALLNNGITTIIIGTGYKNEYYKKFAEQYPQILCVDNDDFANTGSLATLLNIYPHIKDDSILLLESDLLYDPNGLRELIYHREDNVILASNPTNSNDEVYIETTTAHNLVNLSKDASQLANNYGELVGITKLSHELLQSIYHFSQTHSEAKNMDYEDVLVALQQQHAIYVHKIPTYTWCEIDNEEHLAFARATIYPRLQIIKGEPTRNILLNPGPATTTSAVKYAQVQPDICPREKDFGDTMQFVSDELTTIVANNEQYTTMLFPGSGTAAVEAILSSVTAPDEQILIVHNGAYGKRMREICDVYNIKYIMFDSSYTDAIDYNELETIIKQNAETLTHLAIVHNETTTGLLNDLTIVGELCKTYQLTYIVDAMSSYAALPIDMATQNIHFLAASSNKNIQGMAGIGFVIANKDSLEKTAEITPKSYYLNLYAQYQAFIHTHQSRFTPPVQTVYALKQAIIEAKNEGIDNRYARYSKSWQVLIDGLAKLQLEIVVPIEHHSKIITAIYEPTNHNYNFTEMHDYLFKQGFTIYPGKVGGLNTFRIANIGAIDHHDMTNFITALTAYFKQLDM